MLKIAIRNGSTTETNVCPKYMQLAYIDRINFKELVIQEAYETPSIADCNCIVLESAGIKQ